MSERKFLEMLLRDHIIKYWPCLQDFQDRDTCTTDRRKTGVVMEVSAFAVLVSTFGFPDGVWIQAHLLDTGYLSSVVNENREIWWKNFFCRIGYRHSAK